MSRITTKEQTKLLNADLISFLFLFLLEKIGIVQYVKKCAIQEAVKAFCLGF